MTRGITYRNSEHRLAWKSWAKPATVHGHGWSGHAMIRRNHTNSWFAKLCRLNLTSEWIISAVLLPLSPLLNNELPNTITFVGNIHSVDFVHRLVFKIKTKTQLSCDRIGPQKSKGNTYSAGPDRNSYSKHHITCIYVTS
jgi:hypothetical protein